MALLKLENVSKDFYGAKVLENVSFSLEAGEILALAGENGAGKTTLMSILFGMPVIAETGGYGGQIWLDDTPVAFKSPFDALDAGIGMVHQEFSLIPGFTAAENIVLNREPLKPSALGAVFGERLGSLRRDEMERRAERAIARLGVKIGSGMAVSEMPVGHKQFTEIARELSREQVKLLVLDEPTAVLTESEAELLLSSLTQLAAEGIGVIFISHRLREVTAIANRVVVLRDGKIIRDLPARGVSVADIASWMVGRDMEQKSANNGDAIIGDAIHDGGISGAGLSARPPPAKEALRVEHLWVDMPGETVRDVSFTVETGEIFGIGGLAGQGKLGIPNGIMGLYPSGGAVVVEGVPSPPGNPRKALETGMAFVSEDRRGAGLLLDESLAWNIAFTLIAAKGECLKPFFGGLFRLRDEKAMDALAEAYIQKLEIKCTGPGQKARELSGGNQQKICLSKAFALNPRILFVSEPTRGIDVGAKKIVLDTLRAYNRERGITIVMVSSELEELRAICGRVAIVNEGRIEGILPPDADAAEFGLLMSGAAVPTMQGREV
ncbi:MAG: sugar ABC transporter ATP-binding protein [Spirochaetaceae bacterium]|jgi:simple sugar transport system ATP-binding protein|nr:sugar ABC transporter ATP-binding protein [Spirochaetaceae bacterium]